jgi:serine/threonine-protein kinase
MPVEERGGTERMALDSELIARALPQYEVGEEIGRGGWGVVIRGRHRQLDRPVAVKQLPRAFAADPAVQQRFISEARVLASLDHPHVVPIYDYVEQEGLCLLVMELLPGGSVWERFTRHGVTPEAACGIVLAACTALDYAHRAGILHRDIKPENLLFTATGTVKVADFGIAKVLGDSLTLGTRTGEVLGTPTYMAPEQAMGKPLTAATDIYALGVLTYELLAGRPPFTDDGNAVGLLYRHVHEQPTPLRDVASQVPEAIAAVVMRALATDPADRPESAEAYGTALADACNLAWGHGWMERSGVAVMATGPIAERLSMQRVASAEPPTAPGVPQSRITVADAEASPSSRATSMDSPRPSDIVAVSELVSGAGPDSVEQSSGDVPAAGPVGPPGRRLDPIGSKASSPKRSSRRGLLLGLGAVVVVVVVVAAVLLTRGGDGGGGGGGGSEVTTVEVPGDVQFPPGTDTGVELQVGDAVTITATGTVVHDTTTDPTLVSDPDGDADLPDLREFNVEGLPDANHADLIGRIGEVGTPFVVGSRLEFTAETAGRLFLGVNDVGAFNNAGSFDAEISVEQP